MSRHPEPVKDRIQIVQLNSMRLESVRSMHRHSAQGEVFTFRLNSLFAFAVSRTTTKGVGHE